jgi:ABC-2 type transport system ATP-binding protein
MDHGKLLALDTPEALMRGLAGSSTLELGVNGDGDGDGAAALSSALSTLPGVEQVEPLHEEPGNGQDGQVRLRLYVAGDASQLVGPAAALLTDRGLTLSGVELGTPTLEDVFIALTGRSLR